MRNYIHPLFASALLGSALLFLSPNAETTSLGFVDVQRCLDEYPAVGEELAQLQMELGATLEAFQKRRASLDEAESELAVMDATSAQFRIEAFRLDEARKSLDREREFALGELSAKKAELTLRAWSQIRKVAGSIAEEQGLDMVHVLPAPLPGLESGLEARFQAMIARKALWVRPECDITNQVLAVLKSN